MAQQIFNTPYMEGRFCAQPQNVAVAGIFITKYIGYPGFMTNFTN
jgi:hypothetical protein